MLNRIWGRTHLRSTTQQATFFHYSPFGDLNEFTPLSGFDQLNWRLADSSQSSLLTVVGTILLQGRKVRIHMPREHMQIPSMRPSVHWPRIQSSRRSDHDKATRHFQDDLTAWESSLAAWHKSLHALQSTTFGSLNSLEIFQSVLQSLPTANMALFQRVDTSVFHWTEEEFRMVEMHLQQARQYADSAAKSWKISQWQLYPPAFHNDPVSLKIDIDQMIREIDEVHAAMHQLGRKLEKHLRSSEEFPDWRRIQQMINRSTLSTMPNHDLVAHALTNLQNKISSASKSLQERSWFSNWTGFQFISFDELDQEVTTIRQRLERLLQDLPDILDGMAYQEWLKNLPTQVKTILRSLAPHQFASAYSSFPCWYLHRWLDMKTSGADWSNVMDQEKMNALAEQLQTSSLELLALGCAGQSIDEQITWVHEGTGSPGPANGGDQLVDLFWQCTPPGDTAYLDIQKNPTSPMCPELNRIIFLMDQLDPETRMDLPAPMHVKPNFWHPDQVPFKSALSVHLESTLELTE